MENILLINKLYKKENTKEILKLLNEIDAKLNTNRILLRIMKKQRWIGENKFDICINKIYEIGKIVGGLVKYYAKIY